MKILAITHIYPNKVERSKGIFIKRQLDELCKICKVIVVVPIPFYRKIYALLSKVVKQSEKERIKNEKKTGDRNGEVHYTTIWTIPKMGKNLDGIFYFLSVFRLIYSIKKKLSPDIILCFWLYPDGFASTLISKILRLPVVVKAMGDDVNTLPDSSFITRKMIRWTLKNSTRIISPSKEMRQKLIKLGAAADLVEVIPNGVNTRLFCPTNKERARKELGLEIDKKIVLYVGRLSPEKGVEYLVGAISSVKDKEPSILLLIIGDGPVSKRLKRLSNRLGLEKYIHFLGEKRPEEVPLLINACDLICLPSLSEGCPNVILEAFACGRPVVASRVGGVPELIVSDDIGLLVPPRDPIALADGLLEGLNREWSENSILHFVKKRTWFMVSEELFNVLYKTISLRNNKCDR